MVCEIEPHVGLCAENVETAWDSLYLSLSAPPPIMLSLSLFLSFSLKMNKINFEKWKKIEYWKIIRKHSAMKICVTMTPLPKEFVKICAWEYIATMCMTAESQKETKISQQESGIKNMVRL